MSGTGTTPGSSLILRPFLGLWRFACALFTCGPRWTLRHLKPFGGLR